MPDIILHHYPLSPFSEKVRLALGLKGLSYRSVTIPVWMPKPDLMPLTGGYRRANRQRLHAHLTWLAQMLHDGRRFLLGDAPSAADLAAYHPIWFVLKNAGAAGEAMLPMAPLRDWYGRVGAIGHGTPAEMSGGNALAAAKASEPAAPGFESAADDPSVCRAGDSVTVTPDDSGRDPVAGELVACSAQEVVIRRTDPLVGTIQVHFPRAGFEVVPAK